MSTIAQDNELRDAVISKTLLKDAIEWIQKNMAPEDVFTVDQLIVWAEYNEYAQRS